MKALEANDQLRQRMAWALSQIFVAGVPGSTNGQYTETWHNYYDIFVRNAFGSYRDILREVTYSPVMGNYLTFRGGAAFDFRRNYPDENYAREIMLLFSIGLWKLNSDGSRVVDSSGTQCQHIRIKKLRASPVSSQVLITSSHEAILKPR